MNSRDDYLITLYRDVLGEPIRDVDYVLLKPGGGHAYIFQPDQDDISAIADRIGSESVAQRTGKTLLYAAARFPSLLRIIPRITLIQLPVGVERQPDQILLSSRMRLIERQTDVIHTLPRDSENAVRDEIDARQNLPSSLPVPTLLRSDRSVPYFTEQFLEGYPAGHPEDDPKRYLKIYDELLPLYKTTLSSPRSTDSIVKRRLPEASTMNDPVLRRARSWVDQAPLPNVLRACDVHGDLHSANVLVTNDGLCFLDWENRREDLAFVDLLRPLLVQYYARGNAAFLKQMISGTGLGYEFAKSYAEIVGPVIYNEQEWYPAFVPLACLRLLEEMNQETPMWSSCYELLGRLLKEW